MTRAESEDCSDGRVIQSGALPSSGLHSRLPCIQAVLLHTETFRKDETMQNPPR